MVVVRHQGIYDHNLAKLLPERSHVSRLESKVSSIYMESPLSTLTNRDRSSSKLTRSPSR
ncbi:MAG: hypothetical protein F6K19_08410 [Cyanothece sp. SIO1E1]|nr:hypothetical protein [Cyanothece sp. SIO1E1]